MLNIHRRQRFGVALAAAAFSLTVGPDTSAVPPPKYQHYAALGDSYTSAAGELPYAPGGEICNRTVHSYPFQIAQTLGLSAQTGGVTNVACGGARTGDIFSTQQTSAGVEPGPTNAPPQIDAVTADTDLVTISLGGNDSNTFNDILEACVQLGPTDPSGSPCRQHAAERSPELSPTGLADTYATAERNLTTAIQTIRDRAPKARILLVGYPKVFTPEKSCAENGGITAADGDWIDSVFGQFARVFATVAAATKTDFVDLSGVVVGHGICDTNPWIAGSAPFPGQAAGFHPYPPEQAAVATEVLRRLV